MKVITAVMAKNIANDFMHNQCGPVISKAMNEILYAAERGHHKILLPIPTGWDKETICSVAVFFSGLGYSVETHPTAYIIQW